MATKLGRSLDPGPQLTRKLDHHVTKMCQISGGEGLFAEAYECAISSGDILCRCLINCWHGGGLTKTFYPT